MTLLSTALVVAIGFPLLGAAAASAGRASKNEPIPTLLVTGQNNHNWRYTSRVHGETLDATGRFAVEMADDPRAVLADASRVKRYALFVLDYNGPRWGE